jgi:hypothetical protein
MHKLAISFRAGQRQGSNRRGREMTEEFIAIADMEQWEAFVAFNREALLVIAPLGTCLRLAMNCELILGGGAAPLIRVGFVD